MADGCWNELSLGEVINLKRGYDLPTHERQPGPYPVVSSSGFTGWHSEARAESPGVVTGRYGTLGEVYFVDEPFWPLNTTLYVDDFKGNDPRYVAYLLESLDLGGLVASAAVPGINRNHLHPLRVRMPDVPLQRALAAALAAFDRLVQNNRRRIEILEEMARLIYREWFVHFRFPGHEAVELVDGDVGAVPDGWVVSTLGEVSSYINRGVSPKYDEDSTSLVINQRCIRDHRVSLAVARPHYAKVPAEKFVKVGDVLVNSTGVGTLGRVAPVRIDVQDTTVDSHVTIVRPGANVDVDYFAELILSLEPLFESMGAGSTGQTELSRSRVGEAPVLLAPRYLRDAFGELVRPMNELCVNLLAQNRVLSEARDLLLPRLISGELDLSALDLDLDPVA